MAKRTSQCEAHHRRLRSLVDSRRDRGRPPRPAARARLPRAALRRNGRFRPDVAPLARGRWRRAAGVPGLRRARAAARGHAPRGARPGDLPAPCRPREPRAGCAGPDGIRPRRGRARRADRADALARRRRAVRLRDVARRDVLGARDAHGGADLEPPQPVRRRRRRGRRAVAAGPGARRRARRARGDPRSRPRLAGDVRRDHRARRRCSGDLHPRRVPLGQRSPTQSDRRPAARPRRQQEGSSA